MCFSPILLIRTYIHPSAGSTLGRGGLLQKRTSTSSRCSRPRSCPSESERGQWRRSRCQSGSLSRTCWHGCGHPRRAFASPFYHLLVVHAFCRIPFISRGSHLHTFLGTRIQRARIELAESDVINDVRCWIATGVHYGGGFYVHLEFAVGCTTICCFRRLYEIDVIVVLVLVFCQCLRHTGW
jgi:hypothetical protein